MVYPIHISLVLWSIVNGELLVHLQDNNHLPSVPLAYAETLESATDALVHQVAGKNAHPYVEQLYTTADPIEKGSVMIVYMALLSADACAKSVLAQMTQIPPVQQPLPERDVLVYALQRLRWKIEYTNVVYSLLPREFTLRQLQQTYEVILDKALDKRNFRKKILSLGMLKETGKKHRLGIARPAQMYTFVRRSHQYINIL